MNYLNKTLYFVISVLFLALVMAACTVDKDIVTVDRWVVGILPDQDKSEILITYGPLLEHIRTETGIDYEIRMPDSYQQLLDWFGDKTINLALFGGVTFVKAHLEYNAVPVVKRDVDGSFSHYILVRSDIPAKKVTDLKGLRFAFGSRLSTSGHVMPRYYLQQLGINAEKYFSEIHYSTAHDVTARMILDGTVDAGAANSGVIRRMYENGELEQHKVRILEQSPPYQDYVWGVQPDINEAELIKLRKAFLVICGDNEKHREILDHVSAGYYLPAVIEDFEQIMSEVSGHGFD